MARPVVRHSPSPTFGRTRFAWIVALFVAAPLRAQVPEEYTNLQVLPEDISRDRLMNVMRGFTSALGMRCSTCHVGEESRPLSTYDFASDDRPAKLKAREMMKMVGAINGEYLPSLPRRRQPGVDVTCVTCHRGVARPQPIEAVVEETMKAEDLDFAIARYRELRHAHYGGAAYDFTDRPLAGLAQRIARDDPQGAMRLLELNLEFHPRSSASLAQMGALHEQAGDTAAAIDAYRRALAIDPDNQRVQARIRELGGGV